MSLSKQNYAISDIYLSYCYNLYNLKEIHSKIWIIAIINNSIIIDIVSLRIIGTITQEITDIISIFNDIFRFFILIKQLLFLIKINIVNKKVRILEIVVAVKTQYWSINLIKIIFNIILEISEKIPIFNGVLVSFFE